jgi:hypothetical protein
MWRLVAAIYKQSIGYLHCQNKYQHAVCPILKMNINGMSMIFDVGSWKCKRRLIGNIQK